MTGARPPETQPPEEPEEAATGEHEPPHEAEAKIAAVLLDSNAPADRAAETWGADPADMRAAARQGLLPPAVAARDADGVWRYTTTGEFGADDLARSLTRKHIHLAGALPTVCDVTSAWLKEAEAPPETWETLTEWCAHTRTPLTAPRWQLVQWCNRANPADIAHRWQTLASWYGLLTESGIEHANPARRTRLAVAAEDEDTWPNA